MIYEQQIDIRWSDVDLNQHVRHSAYYDFGASARIWYLKKIGFGNNEFNQLKIGPVLFSEQCSFIKEVHLNESITINILKGPTKPDGSQFTLYHEIFNSNGDKCAHIKIQGAWIDSKLRKVTIPPIEIAKGFMKLEEGMDYSYKKTR